MIANQKQFTRGLLLMGGFIAVLIIFFLPLFGGKNGLDYLDDLYNTISKGSAYYIPTLQEGVAKAQGMEIDATLKLDSPERAKLAASLLMKGGALVNQSGSELKVKGSLGAILTNCLADANLMFNNNGKALVDKYAAEEREALYTWWLTLKSAAKALDGQQKFKESKLIGTVLTKGVECAYNYYKVEPKKIGEKWGIVLFSLAFYVFYTLWYGFAILDMFEGWGLKLEH
jgi:hypothetical protein